MSVILNIIRHVIAISLLCLEKEKDPKHFWESDTHRWVAQIFMEQDQKLFF